MKLRNLFFISIVLMVSSHAFAARGGGGGSFFGGGDSSLSFGLGLMTAEQADINRAIEASGAAFAPVSTKNMGSGYELHVQYAFRFSSSMFGMVFRPSYYTNSTTGSGSNGSYDYKLTGFTFFPMMRMVPLENSFISFFMQVGLGYGRLNGEVTEGPNSVSFSGGNFGAMGGIGADFCFTGTHCMTLEGNFRYLPIERNIASSGSGTSFPGFSQTSKDKEVENADGNDFQTTLSGLLGSISYTFRF